MKRQIEMQKKFISMAVGGPNNYMSRLGTTFNNNLTSLAFNQNKAKNILNIDKYSS